MYMTAAQQAFLQRRCSALPWWLMEPGAVAGVPDGFLVIKVSAC
jgi:hypothetical protein